MKTWPLVILVASSLIAAAALAAPPLEQATIDQIINDVRVIDPAKGTFPAKLQQIIKEDLAVRTGKESRAELLFEDHTLTRLAEESIFSFKNNNSRDMQLDRGTMLLQVPKGRGGARIRAASVTASITGTTILIEVAPGKHTKVMVLEGSLKLSPNDFRGGDVKLTAGKMVIVPAGAKQIPPPVDVDIAKVVKSSSLVNPQLFAGNKRGSVRPLPSIGLIEKEIAKQQQLKASHDLVDTNLVILGSGTKVVPADDATLAKLDERSVQTVPLSSLQPAVKPTVIEPTTPLPGTNAIPQPTDQNVLFTSGSGALSQNPTVQLPSSDMSSGPVGPITNPLPSGGGIVPGTTDPGTGTGGTTGGGTTDPGTGTGGTTGGTTTDPGTGTGGTTGGGTTDPGTGTGGTTGGGTTDPGTGTGGTTGGGTTDPGTGTGGTTGGGTTDPGTGTGGTTGGGTTDPGTGTGGTTGGGTTDPGTGTGGTTGGGTTDPGTGTGGTTGGGTTDPGTGTGGTTGGGTTDPGTGTGGTTGGGTTDPGTGTGGTTGGGTTDPGTGTGGTTGGGSADPGTGTGGTTGGGTTDPGTGTGGTTGGGTTDPGTGTGGTTGGGTTDPGTGTGGTTGGGTTDPGTGTGGTTGGGTTDPGTGTGGTTTDPNTLPVVTITVPPVVDSSTWTFAQTAHPWPNPNAQVTVSTTTPFHALPVAFGGSKYVMDPKVIVTTGGTNPTMTKGPAVDTGTIYGGGAVDGSASAFLFGSTSVSDAQLDFDNRFGTNYGASFPSAGVAVYKMTVWEISGAPTFQTAGGPLDIAFIGANGINIGGAGGSWNVSSLHSVFMGTEAGTISLSNKFNVSATSGSGFDSLYIYGRGGNATLSGNYTLPTGKLFVDSTNNAVIANTAIVNAGQVVVNGVNAVQIPGSVTGNLVQLWSGGQITVNGSIDATTLYAKSATINLGGGASITGQNLSFENSGDFAAGSTGSSVVATNGLILKVGGILSLNITSTATTRFDITTAKSVRVEAGTLNIPNSITLPSSTTGILKAGTGGLNAGSYDLTGFGDIAINGGNGTVKNLETKNLTVTGGNMAVSGNLGVDNANVSGDLAVTGTISPRVGDAVSSLRVITAGSIKAGGGLNFSGNNAGLLLGTPNAGYALALTTPGNVDFDIGGINGANFDGGDAGLTSLAEGGDGGSLHVGTDSQPVGGNVTINKAISAASGLNGTGVITGGRGGLVKVVANGTVNVNNTVKVSDTALGRASRQGGNIRIESRKTSGTAISVTSSGQLLSLLSAAAPGLGGRIEFVSQGGDILVNGGTVRADRGTVDIRNNGAGNVSMTNATVRGDVVKVGALGPNGQLIIGGGTINADTMLKLYGGSSNGQVRFTDNVTLGGAGTKIIAGKAVTIDNGKTVTIGGTRPADVYTDNPNYTGSGGNGSTTGSFGGAGAKTNPLNGAPQF